MLARAVHRLAALGLCLAWAGGCTAVVNHPRLKGPQTPPHFGEPVPTEKEKSTLAPYTVEPPDILFIEALRIVPKPPYHFKSTDVMAVEIPELFEEEEPEPSRRPFPGRPRDNRYVIDSAGRIDLGPRYGKVKIGGLSEDEAAQAIRAHLQEKEGLKEPPLASVQLLTATGMQPVTGEHLVSPDGTVNLGTYGLAYVAGLTVDDAKTAIETQLSKYLDEPKVSVSVFAYNSKVYYVITEGAGTGDLVARFPVTGNETVLDAISQINGLSRISSKNVWIARPAPGGVGCDEILPVDWREITKGAATATNYQVLPGDRIFIAENKLIALDSAMNQLIAPFERVFGFTLLGTQTIQTINRFPLGLGGGTGFF
ncbi:MAG TPA: polysaccharide biosynthesis/export family protein [Pirellulales bacterium]|nr:polysaccharide biosynthesis/export family protein [Pirellulales bacterium]